jgi:hypothetical protein
MDNFKYQHSQVLQLVYEANKSGYLNDEEKRKMKELIMNQDERIGKMVQRYEKTKNLENLAKSMKKIVYGEDDDSSDEDLNKRTPIEEQVNSYI